MKRVAIFTPEELKADTSSEASLAFGRFVPAVPDPWQNGNAPEVPDHWLFQTRIVASPIRSRP